jgi:Mn-dependent DtxR family transcriptional regulator
LPFNAHRIYQAANKAKLVGIMDNGDFRTFSEYVKKEENTLTASMEDYLEMIYRLSVDTGFTRIHELSEALSVQPPSATKMVQKLGELNLLKYEKYGVIMLEDAGKKMGESLLMRHNTIEALLKIMGVPKKLITSETEKIEHTISSETIERFERYIDFIKDNPDIIIRLNSYKNES